MVLVAAPVRNRAWILKEYLKAIESIKYDGKIDYYFIINDSIDNSKNILVDFSKRHSNCVLQKIDYGLPPDNRVGRHQHGIFQSLANLRNHILDYFLSTDNDVLFTIDTDIIVKPECLNKLLEVDADIVSAFIWNDYTKHQRGNAMERNYVKRTEVIQHIICPGDEIFSCDVTGACCIIKRKVIESGCRYAVYHQGEDIPFCFSAKDKGYVIKSRQNLAEHRMRREQVCRK